MRLTDDEWNSMVEEKRKLWQEFLEHTKSDKENYFGDYSADEDGWIDITRGEMWAFLHDFTKFLAKKAPPISKGIGLLDVIQYWESTYPADVFVDFPLEIVQVRELLQQIKVKIKKQKEVAE